ncbi:MAG: MutS-related protein, partial [Nannocystaceae bacterium]
MAHRDQTDDPAIDLDPSQTYRTRRELRVQAEELLRAKSGRISNARVAVFLLGFTGFILALVETGLPNTVSTGLMAGAALVFLLLVVVHERVERACARAHEAVVHYERGLARIADPRVDKGAIATDFVGPEHPYAADLDLFGPGSMFALLCTARSRAGQNILASWLAAPATLDALEVRHRAIAGLRQNLDLREDLDLLGGPVGALVDPMHLTTWGEGPALFNGTRTLRVLLWALTIAALTTFFLWVVDNPLVDLGPFPFLGTVAGGGLVYRRHGDALSKLTAPLAGITRELTVLQALLARVEQEPPATPRLRALSEALTTAALPASRQIAKLRRLVAWYESRNNAILAPVLYVVMWPLHFAVAIEAWRRSAGPALTRWLTALGEYEALCALSGYAYEHPQDPLPELTDEGPVLEGTEVGHPLLPESACICNNVALDPAAAVRIVSGSNMSGKSTYLRSVGLNVVLALAGAPVRAQRLRLSPLSVGATLRVEDSLREGASRFYAELTRLRTLVDLSRGQPPLLFLLDEIFHGTNSHDRQLGAKGLID